MKLREIAALVDAEIEGNDAVEIGRVAKIEDAGDGDLTFVANPKYAKFLDTTRASAVLVGKRLQGHATPTTTLLRVEDPYFSFLKILQTLDPPKDPLPPGIHSTAIIPSSTILGQDVRIGAHVVIGEHCVIGEKAVICHGVVIGDGVEVGEEALLYPNVSVREGCRIGRRAIIHSGAAIGSDGFGFAPRPDGSFEKIPQRGIVVIEDDVEIGANCAVDRATIGETRIKKGVKLDNLIQVAHNVVIGENTVIAAQTGISGSTKLGKSCMVGGQVGFTGHLQIADNTKIGAQAGVHHSITESGKAYFGSPALPQREGLRLHAAAIQLPEVLSTVRELKRIVEQLEKRIQDLSRG
jgi:UDP-3-O-[3-hydroxymyristoyl] glucosamine N-acyltransferase